MIAADSQKRAPAAPAAGTRSWFSVTEHLDPKYGGICAIVPELCASVNRSGDCRMSLGGFCLAGEQVPAVPGLEIARYPSGWPPWTSSSLRADFAGRIRTSDGVHIHGIWREHCSLASWYARKADRPYIISAHGMLDDWAVGSKRLKKSLYAAMIERRNCEGARCLHALTRTEAANYRRFGLRRPIAIVPNGIAVPGQISSREFFDVYPQLRNRCLVLFLGRIHPKKGVDLLCRAWPAVRRANSDAHLVVAGPDFENSRSRIESQVAESGMGAHVTFTGMLRDEMKWSALSACGVFILPSHSEGLSVSVLEAMGAARPVIVTRQCHMPEVRTHQCGVEIEPRVEEIAEAVATLLNLTGSQRAAMGKNGEALVRERYSWPAIGRQMTSVYRWAGGGPSPADVELVEN